MRIAVSGASGLIGSALCTKLTSDGHTVRRMVRPNSQAAPRLESSLDTSGAKHGNDLLWQPRSGLVEPEQLNDCDAVVLLAGRSIAAARWSASEKQMIRDSRILATEQLSAQIAKLSSPPGVIVSASATGIYGDRGDEILTESSPVGEGFLPSVAKDWEAACYELRNAGLRVVHPRFGIVLSPDGGALKKMLPIFRLGAGGPLGSGQQYWSCVALDDCIAALVFLLNHSEACGPFNFVSPEPQTNARFTKALGHALHRPAVIPVPRLALKLAMGEMADELLLSSCRVVPERLISLGFSFEFPSPTDYLSRQKL